MIRYSGSYLDLRLVVNAATPAAFTLSRAVDHWLTGLYAYSVGRWVENDYYFFVYFRPGRGGIHILRSLHDVEMGLTNCRH